MVDDTKRKPPSATVTPDDLTDPGRHRHSQLFERENRPLGTQGSGGEDRTPDGLRAVGHASGPDTSRAVARPAEANRPGASSKLGGTPGANAAQSGDTD